jgi:hypothetical protein
MQTERWSIYVAEDTKSKKDSLLSRVFFGKDRSHSFLMLINEDTQKTLKELHFSSFTADGRKQTYISSRPLNMLATVADEFGLTASFTKVAEKIGLGKHLVRIKGTQTNGRRALKDVKSQLAFTGAPEKVMDMWNTACRATVALNREDMPFTAVGAIKAPVNCRAGTEMALESMGLQFHPVTEERDSRVGMGRHLYREIEALEEIHPDGMDRLTLTNRLRENAKLSDAMYRTRPQARQRQARTVA